MALNYDTLYAIPRLTNYAEAKKWHDDVVPIRGDEHGTRPCGRRDQKWFSIWMRNNDVHVGYGSGELEKRQSLVIYHKDGTITVEKRNRWSSASDNERRNRLLGIEFKTHQYDTWVHCAWYDGGQKRKGYLPVKCNGQRGWDAIPAQSTFVRDSAGDMVFLNYTYPVTHKVDRPAMNQALKPFRSFITFIEGLRKLQGTKHLGFSQETYAEYFGWADSLDWHGNRRANVPPPCSMVHPGIAAWRRSWRGRRLTILTTGCGQHSHWHIILERRALRRSSPILFCIVGRRNC